MNQSLAAARRYWVRGEQDRALRTYNRLFPSKDKATGIYYFHQLSGVGYNGQDKVLRVR